VASWRRGRRGSKGHKKSWCRRGQAGPARRGGAAGRRMDVRAERPGRSCSPSSAGGGPSSGRPGSVSEEPAQQLQRQVVGKWGGDSEGKWADRLGPVPAAHTRRQTHASQAPLRRCTRRQRPARAPATCAPATRSTSHPPLEPSFRPPPVTARAGPRASRPALQLDLFVFLQKLSSAPFLNLGATLQRVEGQRTASEERFSSPRHVASSGPVKLGAALPSLCTNYSVLPNAESRIAFVHCVLRCILRNRDFMLFKPNFRHDSTRFLNRNTKLP
jgi:hypothetical protein